jgi:uncharacterized protein (DUF362 family)
MAIVTRRHFLELFAAAAAALPFRGRAAHAAGGEPDIVDVHGSDARKMVAAALAALGGIGRFVKPGDHVVIKPNAGFANPPEWGTTTHPDTVMALAQACLDAKAKQVAIVEFPLSKDPDRCIKRCGLEAAMAAVPVVKLKLLAAREDFKTVEVAGAAALKSVDLAKAMLSADVFINVPAAKAHTETGVSFGLKNAMGLIWDRKAFHTAYDLHQAIADLGRVVKPHLTVLDATRVLLTNGPQGPGDTGTPGRLVVGRNVVSVDAYGLTVARFNQKQMTPADARHIALAGAAGLGEIDVGKLKVKRVEA